MGKDNFIFFHEWREVLQRLPVKTRREVYEAIVEYSVTGEVIAMSARAADAFAFIKMDMDRNDARYAEISKARSEAGKKGMRNRYGRAKKGTGDDGEITNNNKSNKGITSANKSNYKEKEKEKENEKENVSAYADVFYSPPAEPCGPADPPTVPVPHKKFLDLWNEICAPAGLPRAAVLSEGRKNKIRARCTEWGPDPAVALDRAREIFSRMAASDFLRGRKPGCDFRADFNWIVDSPNNWVKVMEGRYDNREAVRQPTKAEDVLKSGVDTLAGIKTYFEQKAARPAEMIDEQ